MPLLAVVLAVIVGGTGALWYALNRLAPDSSEADSSAAPIQASVEGDSAAVDTDPSVNDATRADSTQQSVAAQTTTLPFEATTPPTETTTPATEDRTPPLAEPEPRPQAPVQRPAEPVTGCVSIDVAGGYGTVFIDSMRIQDTPVLRHELSLGSHLIEIRREGYVTFVDTVHVERGDVCTTRRPTLIRQPQ